MGVYLRGGRYYYRQEIKGVQYNRSLGLKRGQEGQLSGRVAQIEGELFSLRHGLPVPVSASSVRLLDYGQNTYLPAHKHKRSYPDDCSRLGVIGEIVGDIPLATFGKREIGKIEKHLLERGCKTTTLNRYMALLRHLFAHAIEDRLIAENPIRLYVPYIEETTRRALSDDEVRAVLCAARAIQECLATSKTQAHIYDIIAVALNTGMRLGEILRLKRECIQDGLIVLPYASTKSRRRSATEKAKVKIIPINEVVRSILSTQPEGGEYVFDIDAGRDHSSIKKTIAEIKRLSGVKEFTMHYLRHTVSTQLAAGVNIAAAKELLGHANLATTLRYTHPGLDEKKSGVSNLGNRFREISAK